MLKKIKKSILFRSRGIFDKIVKIKNFRDKSKTDYYTSWQYARFNFILENYPKDYFSAKNILELGAFNGFIGSKFGELGAHVTSVEGREENCELIQRQSSIKKVICANLDTPDWNFGKFDIVINFGLLYHLQSHHERLINNCIDNCNLMFLESVIYDSFEDELYCAKENGHDQSLSDMGCTPSTSWVENRLRKKGTSFIKYANRKLNGNGHHYDWLDKDSKKLDRFARRFWIVKN